MNWVISLEKHWLFIATLVPSVRVPSKTVSNLPPPSSLLKFSVMAYKSSLEYLGIPDT